jgi:hypothetical protein
MSILKELLGLTDPDMLFEADVPVELKDVIAAFPKHHGKALEKLWGGKRLVWHGKRFFDDDELGAAYIEAEKAAEAYIEDGYNTDAHLDISGTIDGEDYSDSMTWDVQFEKDEKQECYLGYDPKSDKLYIGFDAWASEEEFNSAFDKAFEDMTGEEHDMDNEEHQAIFHEAFEAYKELGFGFWGLIFEITMEGDEMVAEEALPPMTNGFYKGTYKLFKQQHPNVVDLRLD